MAGGILGGNDNFVSVGLNGVGVAGELGGVALDDMVGGARESLFVEAVLEDGALCLLLHL